MPTYHEVHRRSIEEPELFWADEARRIHWETPFEKGAAWVLERSGTELVPTLYLEAPAITRAGLRQPV